MNKTGRASALMGAAPGWGLGGMRKYQAVENATGAVIGGVWASSGPMSDQAALCSGHGSQTLHNHKLCTELGKVFQAEGQQGQRACGRMQLSWWGSRGKARGADMTGLRVRG